MSMRGTIDGLPTPHPIGERLPALFQDDEFALRFTAGLDTVLAPVLVTLDCLAAYLDAELAPDDFVAWLATWVGLVLDEGTPPGRARELLARAIELHRLRGTAAGLGEHVWLATGCETEVLDSGGCAWSTEPGTPLPGHPQPGLHVRVAPRRGAEVDAAWLDAFVAALKPAHLPHTVEVVEERSQ
jgi:phage tail-like protein